MGETMQHVFAPVRKLQWQLSLSYIMVVMVAIPALLGVGLALLVILTPPATRLSPAEQLVQGLESKIAPQLLQGMQGHPNQRWLEQWTINFIENQRTKANKVEQEAAQLNVAEKLAVMILDPGGQVIASDPSIPPSLVHPGLSTQQFLLQKLQLKTLESQNVIRAAFANDQRLDNLVYTFVDGRTIAAVPIVDAQQGPIGVLFVVVKGLKGTDSPPAPSNPVSAFFSQLAGGGQQYSASTSDAWTPSKLLLYATLLIIITSVIGTAFGVVTARRITCRLQRITSAVHAWSRGHFEVTVSDSSPDELGQLALDLNRMAQQVQVLLDTRRELALMEERQRVARDLHDSVKQHAFAISLLIGAAQSRLPGEPEAAQTYLVRAGDLADHTRQELTAILQQLRPAALVEEGLRMALQDYTRQWSQRTAITAEFSAQGGYSMPLDIEEALFRIAQEALANVARHSQASQTQVQLEQEPGQVCLMIHDNGTGFDMAQGASKGQGLTNMRERVEAHRGTLSIASETSGTLVKACIPLVTSQPVGIQAAAAKEDYL
jgi:two-component system, NarL family, sensor histidine kinase LiaS